MNILAVTLCLLGSALLLGHVVAWVIAGRRRREDRPELAPMGYIGVGLLLAMVAFYLARGLSQGDWGGVSDLAGLLLVLGVASWGFGAAYEWAQRLRPGLPSIGTAPLMLATLTGLSVGLAAGGLGV